MPLPAEERAPRSAVIHVSDMRFDGAPCRCVYSTLTAALSRRSVSRRPARCRDVNRDRRFSPVPAYLPFPASTLPVPCFGLCVAKRSTTAPTAPVPLSSRAAASLHPRTPRTRPGPGGLARRQRSRSCTTSAKQLLLQRTTRPHELTDPRWPEPVPRTDSVAPACPREPQRPHSELRHALHTARI